MPHLIKIASRKEFDSRELWEMHRLRAKVFKERMGWEVPIMSGMEIDGYDALDPYYMMIRDSSTRLRGCWRALPTKGPYMLKDTFPELLYGHLAPEDPKIWELSRFAIEADGPQGFGFSGISLDALREIVKFGDSMGIEHYVTVTTASIERMMRRAGFAVTRYGSPMRIGVEIAVALNFDIGEQTHEALFGKLLEAA
ncbi:MAG: GNAT family N-acetyltransferase [Gallionellaceae bacterium]|jgi:acyl homoserine lactone synthase|nr:GNAT family N-acetyltransferase [Gallionellaceae bacterium]